MVDYSIVALYCSLRDCAAKHDRELAGSLVPERAVCVRWWTIGSWAPLGYRLRNQMSMSRVTSTLLYCTVLCATVQAGMIASSLANQGVSERVVCVRWWTMGSCPLGYRLRDQMRMSRVTLGQLASPAVVHHLRTKYSHGQWRRGRPVPVPHALGNPAHGSTAGAGAGVGQSAFARAGAGVGGGFGQEAGAGAARGVPGVRPGAAVPAVSELSESEQEALKVARRLVEGTMHEVMRVQISADFQKSAWVGRDMIAISHVQLGCHSRSYPATVQ